MKNLDSRGGSGDVLSTELRKRYGHPRVFALKSKKIYLSTQISVMPITNQNVLHFDSESASTAGRRAEMRGISGGKAQQCLRRSRHFKIAGALF
ncbi:MAG: hypothetical protein LBQ51_08005 [Desulfovibrio sp.]|nr:hypothetical protein [Desulfovibrio sp.]